jgi:hypothetical protein
MRIKLVIGKERVESVTLYMPKEAFGRSSIFERLLMSKGVCNKKPNTNSFFFVYFAYSVLLLDPHLCLEVLERAHFEDDYGNHASCKVIHSASKRKREMSRSVY